MGKKRNKIEYETKWVGYDATTWQSGADFQTAEPDPESNSRYIPMFDDFKRKMKNNEVNEYKEEKEQEDEIDKSLPPALERMKENHVDDIEIYGEKFCRKAFAHINKANIKGGIEVPENRKEAKNSKSWIFFRNAEETELKLFEIY